MSDKRRMNFPWYNLKLKIKQQEKLFKGIEITKKNRNKKKFNLNSRAVLSKLQLHDTFDKMMQSKRVLAELREDNESMKSKSSIGSN